MVSHRVRGLNNVYHCVLAGMLTLFFWGYLLAVETTTYLLSLGAGLLSAASYDHSRYIIYNVAAITALSLAAFRPGSRRGHALRCDALSNHRAALANTFAVGGSILLVLVATKDLAISRVFLFTFLPLLYIAFFFCHRFIPRFLLRTFFRQRLAQRALLLGPLEKVEGLEEWCVQMSSLGVEFTCFYDGLRPGNDKGADVLACLERAVRRQRIAHVVVLGLPDRREFVLSLMAVCNRVGARLLVVNALGDFFARRVTQSWLGGVEIIDVLEEPLEDPLNRLCKRALDALVAALVVGFVLPPFALTVWVVQQLQAPGPLFFRQTRSGRDNRPFRILKFRTMYAVRRPRSEQATRADARVFPFGRFLRRTSLDEIPQFINVLRGEMSVVGPRPHMVIHNRKFCRAMESYHVRAFVKPGITGVAQVRGCRGEAKTEAEIAARVRFDLDYVERWSIWRDVGIILETVRQVFFPPRTAY